MNILPLSEQSLAEALNTLNKGGIVAHATETCYGLACDLRNPDAVQKLFDLKKRPEDMPVSALFRSIEHAKEYVEWNDKAQELTEQYLPGPLTIILPLKSEIVLSPTPEKVLGIKYYVLRTIGIRVSSHPTAQKLVEEFDSPISTTSANIHGQPNPFTAQEIIDQYKNEPLKPDLILDSGKLATSDASTVIDCSKADKKILRQGTISLNR